MIKNKSIYSLIIFSITAFVVVCVVLFFVNIYFKKHYTHAFVANESSVEDGKGKLQCTSEKIFTYRIDEQDGSLMIVHFQGHYLEDKIEYLVVDSIMDGHTVTCIEEGAFSWDHDLRKITLPNTIETIRSYACANLPNLKEVECSGENLKEIQEDAFPDFKGTIVTKKNSILWDYAIEHDINVKEYEQ